MRTCTRVAGVLLALGLFAGADATSAGYDLQALALDGDAAPDAGGASYDALDLHALDLNEAGEVAFGARLAGSPPAWGLFVHSGGATAARALTGDPAPAPLGGSYVLFGFPQIDDAGQVSFGVLVRLSPTDTANALVQAGLASDTLLVSELDSAPGAGGTLELHVGDTSIHALGPGGAPVFRSDVIGGSAATGVFVGAASAVALLGDASPAGGTYHGFGQPGASTTGSVAFPATIVGAPSGGALFVDPGTGAYPLVLAGELDPEGATYMNFLLPQMNAAGDVMFMAEWPDGVSGGVYVAQPTGIRSVARTGQVVPETGGGILESLGGPAHLSETGAVAFGASLTGGSVAAGVFLADPDGTLELVAQSGDPVPGAPGESFASFNVAASNSDGSVAFTATSDAGTRGVFLAAPQAAHVPSVSPAGLVALAALLGLLGVRSRRA
jgi:hypothetical protein